MTNSQKEDSSRSEMLAEVGNSIKKKCPICMQQKACQHTYCIERWTRLEIKINDCPLVAGCSIRPLPHLCCLVGLPKVVLTS